LFIAGYTICQSGDDRRTWRDLIAGEVLFRASFRTISDSRTAQFCANPANRSILHFLLERAVSRMFVPELRKAAKVWKVGSNSVSVVLKNNLSQFAMDS
jgi:hypothetical protein